MSARLTVAEVGPGVHRFGDGIVNAYALSDGDEVTLVDAGFPRSMDALVDALGRAGHQPADVTTVLITHGHIDHMGTARRWQRDHAARVHAHPDELARLQGRRAGGRPAGLALAALPSLWRRHTWRFLLHGLRHGLLRPDWLEEIEVTNDDEQLDVPGRPRAIATPGHTEGHLAFHLPDAGMVLTGDALTTVNVLSGERGPQVEALTVDRAAADRSLERVAALDVEVLLPGHGEPWRGPAHVAVDAARRRGAGATHSRHA